MQTQTTVRAKTTKKMLYSSIGVSVAALALAYVIGSVFYKFYAVEDKTMGTMFYSWRLGGADDVAFMQKSDKFKPTDAQKEKASHLDMAIDKNESHRPIHVPRNKEHHLTFAFPNIDVFFTLWNVFSKRQSEIEKKYPAEKKEMLKEYLKVTEGTPVFTNEDWEDSSENFVKRSLYDYYSKLGAHPEQRELVKKVTPMILSFIQDMMGNKDYRYTGMEPSEEAVNDLADIIYEFIAPGHLGEESFRQYIEKNDDSERFLEKRGIVSDDKKEFSKKLSRAFFDGATNGSLHPYFSLGYSNMVNVVLYLSLDMDNLEYEKDAKVDAAESFKSVAQEQQIAANKIAAITSAIAFGMAKNLSPSEPVGIETVRKHLNPVRFMLFTSKVVDPSPHDESNLEKILENLKKKESLIKQIFV
ncbi:uncharacterized protein NEMAJ01_0847 [Nematocida major]|uniref:uncharacterized protein n=1 Tax=Nematocida major TaxID=1912982 RepID=UPI0020074F6E|nr:uncharacterized protein NEMAJ01_0847 [Nematocida major]KAH9385951.1 hypothetical protein NEMAJ01_0847 [Nematocida major]